jgi:hypothetical protein
MLDAGLADLVTRGLSITVLLAFCGQTCARLCTGGDLGLLLTHTERNLGFMRDLRKRHSPV